MGEEKAEEKSTLVSENGQESFEVYDQHKQVQV